MHINYPHRQKRIMQRNAASLVHREIALLMSIAMEFYSNYAKSRYVTVTAGKFLARLAIFKDLWMKIVLHSTNISRIQTKSQRHDVKQP